MTDDERAKILQSEKLSSQVYLFTCDWANRQIGGTAAENKKKLARKIMDDVQAVAYAVSVMLIDNQTVRDYPLPAFSERVESGVKRTVCYEVDGETIKKVVDSILDSRTDWLLGGE